MLYRGRLQALTGMLVQQNIVGEEYLSGYGGCPNYLALRLTGEVCEKTFSLAGIWFLYPGLSDPASELGLYLCLVPSTHKSFFLACVGLGHVSLAGSIDRCV